MIHYRLNTYNNFTLVEVYPEQGFFAPLSAEETIKCFGVYHHSGNVKFINATTNEFSYKFAGEFHNDVQSMSNTSVFLEAVEANTSFAYLTTYLHNLPNQQIFASRIEVFEETSISPGAGVLVIRGQILANDNNTMLQASELNYIKPREYAYSISGNATVLLIT